MLQPHIIQLVINTQNHISAININGCSTGNPGGLLLSKLGNVPHLQNSKKKKLPAPCGHSQTTKGETDGPCGHSLTQ